METMETAEISNSLPVIEKKNWRRFPKSTWKHNRLCNWLLYSPYNFPNINKLYDSKIGYKEFHILKNSDLIKLGIQSKWHQSILLKIIDEIRPIPSLEPKLPRKNSAPSWTIENVMDWLDSLNFGWNFIHRFEDLEIEGKFLVRLNDRSLEKLMGISSPILRKRYIFAINSLSKSGNWSHLPSLDSEIDEKYPQNLYGFFSPSFVVARTFKTIVKTQEARPVEVQNAFFPFNNKQINLSMFSYKGEYTRKKKRNLMDIKDVLLWLIRLNYPKEVVRVFEEKEINGMRLFELEEDDLQEFKIDLKTRTKLICDISTIRQKMKKLFDISNLVNIYNQNYFQTIMQEKATNYKNLENLSEKLRANNNKLINSLLSKRSFPSLSNVEPSIKPHSLKPQTQFPSTKKSLSNLYQTKLVSKWTLEDVASWAHTHPIAKEYNEIFSQLSGPEMLSCTKNSLSDKFGLNFYETEEVMACINSIRPKIHPLISSKVIPNSSTGKLISTQVPPSSHKKYRKSMGSIKHIDNLVLPHHRENLVFENSSQTLSKFITSNTKIASPPLFVQRAVSSAKIRKMSPPPPPDEPRPPFDVGIWNSRQVFAYLKTIKSLNPFLDSVRGIDGRKLLDITDESALEIGIKNAQCLHILRNISKRLSFRDLKNCSIEAWTPDNVQTWFEIDTEVPKYGRIFFLHNMNGKFLLQLTHEVLLTDFGISLRDRAEILKSIQRLLLRSNSPPKYQQSPSFTANLAEAHTRIPIALWGQTELESWLLSFPFGALYLEQFRAKVKSGEELIRMRDTVFETDIKVTIGSHKKALTKSLQSLTRSDLKDDRYGEIFSTVPSRKEDSDGGEEMEKGVPMDCSFCRRKFSNTDLLIAHLEIHEKRCPFCTGIFSSMDLLNEHLALKHRNGRLPEDLSRLLENIYASGEREINWSRICDLGLTFGVSPDLIEGMMQKMEDFKVVRDEEIFDQENSSVGDGHEKENDDGEK